VGKKSGPNPTDRAKKGTKRSLLTDGRGVPLAVVIAGANQVDFKLFGSTLDALMVARPAPTPERPQGMCLDKGYDYREIYDRVEQEGFTPHIRYEGEGVAVRRDPEHRARRWVVERTHSWMNRFRALLIRWQKGADSFLGLVQLACAIITLKQAGLLG
jgi:putative transposase